MTATPPIKPGLCGVWVQAFLANIFFACIFPAALARANDAGDFSDSALKLPPVQATYHLWFTTPQTPLPSPKSRGKWALKPHYSQWNHFIEDSTGTSKKKYPRGIRWRPPLDICSRYYPLAGVYSSHDSDIRRNHLHLLKKAGVNLLVVPFWLSWTKEQELSRNSILFREGERNVDLRVRDLLDDCLLMDMEVTFMMMNHRARNVQFLSRSIEYLHKTYANHRAVFRTEPQDLMVFYVQDVHTFSANQWKAIIDRHETTTRFIGTWVDERDADLLIESGFHGFTSASSTAGFAANQNKWRYLSEWAKAHNKSFIPSVSPGFDDTRSRPWNADNIIDRSNGQYFESSWRNALKILPVSVLISSFNDWCRGTQIEPARVLNAGSAEDCFSASVQSHERMCKGLMKSLDEPDRYPPYGTIHNTTNAYLYLNITQDFAEQLKAMHLSAREAMIEAEVGGGGEVEVETM